MLEAKFAISTLRRDKQSFVIWKKTFLSIDTFQMREGEKEGILENGIQTLTSPQESTLDEPAGFHFHLFLC